jgi:hypothetical protein
MRAILLQAIGARKQFSAENQPESRVRHPIKTPGKIKPAGAENAARTRKNQRSGRDSMRQNASPVSFFLDKERLNLFRCIGIASGTTR